MVDLMVDSAVVARGEPGGLMDEERPLTGPFFECSESAVEK